VALRSSGLLGLIDLSGISRECNLDLRESRGDGNEFVYAGTARLRPYCIGKLSSKISDVAAKYGS